MGSPFKGTIGYYDGVPFKGRTVNGKCSARGPATVVSTTYHTLNSESLFRVWGLGFKACIRPGCK